MPRILRGPRPPTERSVKERDYVVACVSLYPEDDARLDRIVASRRVIPSNRSAAIRAALEHYERTVLEQP